MKPDFTSRSSLVLAGFLAAALAASCGGGGGGGISGTGIVFGPITQLGSVVVDDIRFDTDSAAVTINGAAATDDQLRIGMLVTIRGTVNETAGTGVANSVVFDATLEGPVEAVDTAAGTLQVLSQLITTDAETEFDGTSLATLDVDDIVEVSGFIDGDGIVRATRVELDEDEVEFELEGTVSGLDEGAETFGIGLLTISFADAEIIDESGEGLQNGVFVEVFASTAPTGGVLEADEIFIDEDEFDGEEGEELEIEGFVTSVIAPDFFVVNFVQEVRINEGTEFSGGDESDIVVNARLEVEGLLDAGDVLVAEAVEFEEEEDDEEEDEEDDD